MHTNIPGMVPQDELQSAGYALLLVFLRKAIYQAATVGGDLEVAALKWAFEEGMRSNGVSSTRKEEGAKDGSVSQSR